ncbi:MAG: hypothetical protein IT233_00720 [Bacteroidia bacterium]|nr:hypothetical protein [Bacteroidia bacterium]
MKYTLIISIFCLTILSCSDSTNSSKEDVVEEIDLNAIQINATLPFGCINLTKLKYPMEWTSDLKNYGQLKNPEELDSIGKCFYKINSSKVINSPVVKKSELLLIGDFLEQSHFLDTILQNSIDSCRFRLPNIGIYECYYSFQRDVKISSFGSYGNLLLLDPKTKTGKLLNIYFEGSGDSNVMSRYFFIDKDTIIIYEGRCYDDGCDLDEKYKINIAHDGSVNINRKE